MPWMLCQGKHQMWVASLCFLYFTLWVSKNFQIRCLVLTHWIYALSSLIIFPSFGIFICNDLVLMFYCEHIWVIELQILLWSWLENNLFMKYGQVIRGASRTLASNICFLIWLNLISLMIHFFSVSLFIFWHVMRGFTS